MHTLLQQIVQATPNDGNWHMVGMYTKREGEGILIDDVSRLEPAE